MKEKSKNTETRQEIIMEFLKVIAAKPSKRYPVFVWKITSIFPNDILAMFMFWLKQSRYQNYDLFKKSKYFFNALYECFDLFGLTWYVKTSYKREKIYFGNLRLKQNGCRLLMDIGARTYIGD